VAARAFELDLCHCVVRHKCPDVSPTHLPSRLLPLRYVVSALMSRSTYLQPRLVPYAGRRRVSLAILADGADAGITLSPCVNVWCASGGGDGDEEEGARSVATSI
jgi:hypothetical protein